MLKVLDGIYSFFYYPLKRLLKSFFSYLRCIFLFIYKTDKFENILRLTIKLSIYTIYLWFLVNIAYIYEDTLYSLININKLYKNNYSNQRHYIYGLLFLGIYLCKLIITAVLNSKYLLSKLPTILIKFCTKSSLLLGTTNSSQRTSKFYKNVFLFYLYVKLFTTRVQILLNLLIIILKKYFLHYFGFVVKLKITLFKSFIFQLTKVFFIFWRPLFKKLSYFGLFRTYRTKWFWKD